ncbi:MAG: DUF4127 family protein [Armatimonadetes bacterium]|nr:DUF4127 family protein [Armatimonadota bacterium]
MSIRHRPHRILYLPADDRPCSIHWPRLLCRMVDWDLVMPPANLLGWFNEPGKPEELAAWLLEAARQPFDGAVLSLDMLAYGGMRAAASSGTRTALAQRRLEVLAPLREAMGSVPICGLASILGLTAMTRSDEAARYGHVLRDYSVLAGRARATGGAASEELRALEASLPPSVIGEYVAIRGRNHEINRRALEETSRGRLDLLVFAQDEAAQEGIHRDEQADLRAAAERLGVADRAVICNAGPEIAMLLIARLIHEHMTKVPEVRPIYSNELAAHRVPPGEDRPLTEQVAIMTKLMGGRLISQGEADLVPVINCPLTAPRETVSHEPYHDERRLQLENLLGQVVAGAAGRGLAVLDVALPDCADGALVEALFSTIPDLPAMLSFFSWGRAGNTLAAGLAHAAIRLIALQDKGAFDLAHHVAHLTPMRYLSLLDALIESEKAHVSLLFSRFVEDYLYSALVRPQVEEHVIRLIRGSVVDLREVHERAEYLMRDLLGPAVADLWIEHFLSRTSVKIGREPNRSAVVLAEMEEARLRYPWRRLAEIEVEVDFGVELVAE